MSSTPAQTYSTCAQCASPLAPEDRACTQCFTLVHGAQLESLIAQATEAERRSEHLEAIALWNSALGLLPYNARQAAWVRQRIETLEAAHHASQQHAEEQQQTSSKWKKYLGPLAPVGVFLAKAKGFLFALFKLKFLLGFTSYFALYWLMFGWRFALGFVVSILIHELGHYVEIRRRGLPADMPVFLPGFGAYVRWTAIGVTLQTRALIALAGPIAGLLAAAGSFMLYRRTGLPLWAAIAHVGAMLNVLNLTPVWTLDGKGAAAAIGTTERWSLLLFSVALWAITGEGVYFFIVLGFAYRLFRRDAPAQSSWLTTCYFAFLLATLGIIFHLAPDLRYR